MQASLEKLNVLFQFFLLHCIIFLSEALFGMAPFSSGSFAELEKKIRSSDPIVVREKY